MGNLKRKRSLILVGLASVFLMRPSRGFADDANGPPNPPFLDNGTEGKIEIVKINGFDFLQGRRAVWSFEDPPVFPPSPTFSVVVDTYAPEGIGGVLELQRHTRISYLCTMRGGLLNRQVGEFIAVLSTGEDKVTGTTTTDRDDFYDVRTKWESAGASYALLSFNARSVWKSETEGSSGNFGKDVEYFNERAADGNSFVKHQVRSVNTACGVVDPFWGAFSFIRSTSWDTNTGQVTSHSVSINDFDLANPFAWSMIEAILVAAGVNPQITDPKIPALSVPPLEWPQQP